MPGSSVRRPASLLPAQVKVPLRRSSLALRGAVVRQDRRRHAPAQAERLNIGGGNWYRRGWHNVDLYAHPAFADIAVDFRLDARLPVDDDSLEVVFSSHVIEHVDDETVATIVREAHRALRPGGVLRLATPDPAKAFAAYHRGDSAFFDRGGVSCHGDTIEQKLVNYFASYREGDYSGGPIVDPAEVAQRVADESTFPRWCVEQIPDSAPYRAHVNSWSAERLTGLLRETGFSEVWESGFGQSVVPELREPMFDNRPTVSLFVEAFA